METEVFASVLLGGWKARGAGDRTQASKRPAHAQQPNVYLEPKWLRCSHPGLRATRNRGISSRRAVPCQGARSTRRPEALYLGEGPPPPFSGGERRGVSEEINFSSFLSSAVEHGLGTKDSATGTRTRVARVRAEYPNQLDYSGCCNSREAEENKLRARQDRWEGRMPPRSKGASARREEGLCTQLTRLRNLSCSRAQHRRLGWQYTLPGSNWRPSAC